MILVQFEYINQPEAKRGGGGGIEKEEGIEESISTIDGESLGGLLVSRLYPRYI